MIQKPRESNQDGYKRWFDLTILLVTNVLLSPALLIAFLVIPVLILLDDWGPIFFKQQRTGKNGRVFTIFKFRTMVLNSTQTGPTWTKDGDPRVTRVGKILRRTALDELPELLNIWKGDMSLVGPRALEVEEHRWLEQHVDGFAERLQVRPGLTGLAQVRDRLDDANDKFRYDLEYVNTMGPWLDLRLLAFSVLNTVSARWDRRNGKPAMNATWTSQVLPDSSNTETELETVRRQR